MDDLDDYMQDLNEVPVDLDNQNLNINFVELGEDYVMNDINDVLNAGLGEADPVLLFGNLPQINNPVDYQVFFNRWKNILSPIVNHARVSRDLADRYTFVYIFERSMHNIQIDPDYVGDVRALLLAMLYAKIMRSLKATAEVRGSDLQATTYRHFARITNDPIGPPPAVGPLNIHGHVPEAYEGYFARLNNPQIERIRQTYENTAPQFRIGYETDAAQELELPVRHSSYRYVPPFAGWRYNASISFEFFHLIRDMLNQIAGYAGEYGENINVFHLTANLHVRMKLFRTNGIYRQDRTQLGIPDFGGAKMFYRSLEPITDTIIRNFGVGKNDEKRSGMCFPMSFVNSQYRLVTRVGADIQWYESSPNVFCLEELVRPIRIRTVQTQNSLFVYNGSIIMGKPQQVQHTPLMIDAWVQTAHEIHEYVCATLGFNITANHWTITPQMYANVFRTFIHVYKGNRRGRYEVYVPCNIVNEDGVEKSYWDELEHRHVYMYYKDNHFYPIHSIRHFMGNAYIHCLGSLCDYCQKITLDSSIIFKGHALRCIETRNLVSPLILNFEKTMVDETPFYRYYEDREKNTYAPTGLMVCNICYKKLPYEECGYDHECSIHIPKVSEPIPDELIYVLDMEAMQDYVPADEIRGGKPKYQHTCVLVCLQNVYTGARAEFTTISDFVDYVLLDHMKGTTILAHNGGGYDYQFLVIEFERREIIYEKIPRPSSKHKYLQINMYQPSNNMRKDKRRKADNTGAVRFIDFMALVPGSLKAVAKAFKLPVQKGDFPHKFLNSETIHYEGAFPPLFSEEDFFGYRDKKTPDDQDEIKEWHEKQLLKYCDCWKQNECQCGKQRWNAREFLTEYCWLDVEVLSQAVSKYREFVMNLGSDELTGGWKATPQDPLHSVTQSQLAMRIYLGGWKHLDQGVAPDIYVVKTKERKGKSWMQYVWLEEEQARYNNEIVHGGNGTGNEYYIPKLNAYVSGYHDATKTCFMFYDCAQFDCEICRQKVDEDCRAKQLLLQNNIISLGYSVIIRRSHQVAQRYEGKEQEGTVHVDRELFYGGRTEVFSAFADKNILNQDINYHDVCSLYPYVCAFKKLPIGKPTYLMKKDVDMDRLDWRNGNRYFGFARVKVECNKRDLLGLLPSRDDEERLTFNLYDKVGYWATEELYLALENGYKIVEVYQVIHFEEDQVSDVALRGYIECFLRMKQESEKWTKHGASSDNPSEEEKDELVERIYQSNGRISRMRKENVCDNPVMRNIAKIFLNCLWGKFCQRQNRDVFCDITNYQEYEYLASNPKLDGNKMTFRQASDSVWKLHYVKNMECVQPNNKYNIFIAAYVTAHARCILHRQMLSIGPERVLYCDTDSIIFLSDAGQGKFRTGIGLGKWTDEYPNKDIRILFAFAPKSYIIVEANDDMLWKSKGAWLTVENKAKLTLQRAQALIYNSMFEQDTPNPIEMKNMTIFANTTDTRFAYASLMTRYNTKMLQCVYSKRKVLVTNLPAPLETTAEDVQGRVDYWSTVGRIHLLPFGYEES